MKTIFTAIALFISFISFGQTIEQKKIEKENFSFFDSYTFDNVLALEKNLKTTVPLKIFETYTSGTIVFTPQNLAKNIAFQDFSKYILKDELQKVMLEIPGLKRPIDYKGFQN